MICKFLIPQEEFCYVKVDISMEISSDCINFYMINLEKERKFMECSLLLSLSHMDNSLIPIWKSEQISEQEKDNVYFSYGLETLLPSSLELFEKVYSKILDIFWKRGNDSMMNPPSPSFSWGKWERGNRTYFPSIITPFFS